MDQNLMSNYKSAMYKIRSVLKHSERDSIATIEGQIIMSKSSHDTFNQSAPHALQTLLESIAHKRQVTLSYQGANDTNPHSRTIEPIGLFHESNFWYVGAYCLKRKDYRQFRADRIFTIELLSSTFTRSHISLSQLMDNRKKNIPTQAVHLRVGLQTAPLLDWQKNYFGFTHESRSQEHIDLFFAYQGPADYFCRWFMSFADDASIVTPDSLRDSVEILLRNSLKRIKS